MEVWGPVHYADWVVGGTQQVGPRGRRRRQAGERRRLHELGMVAGVDFCEHALERSDEGRVVEAAHLATCAVCLRRWRVTEAELQPWVPMDHEQAAAILPNMADAFGSSERDGRYRPFYAHLAQCPECERRLARLTYFLSVRVPEEAALRG